MPGRCCSARPIGLIDRLAGCFADNRRGDRIEHPVRMLIGQRVFGMALGYEDLNDQEPLRHDPVPRQAHRAAQGVCTPGRQEHAEPAGPAHPTMRLAIGITASAPTRRRSMRCGSSCLGNLCTGYQ
jgi:hypothetical protein